MNLKSFTVTDHQWGVLISLPLGFEEFKALSSLYKKIYGYDIIHGLIGQKFNALCLTNEHNSRQWEKELGI